MRKEISQKVLIKKRMMENSAAFEYFTLFLTLCLFAAVPISAVVTKTGVSELIDGLFSIFTGPSRLVTDYFSLGCLASTLLNAGICGLACNLIMIFSRAQANSTTFAAYILVIAHCFYGLNFINMWPPFLGVAAYCIYTKHPLRGNLHVAMFSTALAPFISDFIFFYPPFDFWRIGGVSIPGILLSLLFGIGAGFLVPALIKGTSSMCHGYSMYKAGLAIGLLGIFVYCFLYKTLGVEGASSAADQNATHEAMGHVYYVFMNVFFAVIFLASLTLGFILNGKSFKNYKKLLRCTGWGLDFADKFGMPLCFINFGLYGFCILIYLNVVFVLPILVPAIPTGVGFTGATAGVVFAALAFSADGQHPRNVAPIALGYSVLFAAVSAICTLMGSEIPWSLSAQSYINGLAFATGLCPIAGKYGFKFGVVAGLVSAIICTSTAAMHGGFVLYNGGFNAGLAALIMIPVLDFYHINPKYADDDDEVFAITDRSR